MDTAIPIAGRCSPAQAAKWLEVTPQRVRQLVDEGALAAVRTPLGRLIDVASVQALAVERAQRSRRRGR